MQMGEWVSHDMTHANEWVTESWVVLHMQHDWVACATRLNHMCNTTQSHVQHNSVACATSHIDTVISCRFVCATWLIHMCGMTRSYVCCTHKCAWVKLCGVSVSNWSVHDSWNLQLNATHGKHTSNPCVWERRRKHWVRYFFFQMSFFFPHELNAHLTQIHNVDTVIRCRSGVATICRLLKSTGLFCRI